MGAGARRTRQAPRSDGRHGRARGRRPPARARQAHRARASAAARRRRHVPRVRPPARPGRRTTTHGELASFTPAGQGRRHVPDRRPQGRRHRRRLHGARRLGRRPARRPRRRARARPSGPSSGGCRYVRLLDAAGGSVRSFEEIGRTYLPDGNSFTPSEVDAAEPGAGGVGGDGLGRRPRRRCTRRMAHWNVMVDGTGRSSPAGRRSSRPRSGYDITKEELGGAAHPHPGERRRRQPRGRPRRTRSRRSAASCRTCRPASTSWRRAASPRDPVDRRAEELRDAGPRERRAASTTPAG